MAEAAHFSRDIQTDQEPRANGQEGLRDLQYITQIYKSAGIKI
jgi:predicted dehydrogenase